LGLGGPHPGLQGGPGLPPSSAAAASLLGKLVNNFLRYLEGLSLVEFDLIENGKGE